MATLPAPVVAPQAAASRHAAAELELTAAHDARVIACPCLLSRLRTKKRWCTVHGLYALRVAGAYTVHWFGDADARVLAIIPMRTRRKKAMRARGSRNRRPPTDRAPAARSFLPGAA